MANKRFKDWDPISTFTRLSRIAIYDDVIKKDRRIFHHELLGRIPVYDAATTYIVNDMIQHLGIIYKSIAAANLGNTPASSPTKWTAAVGGGSLEPNPKWTAGNFYFPAVAPAELDTNSGLTNGILKRHLFDDTVNEHVLEQFNIPRDINPAGNVTFRLDGTAFTAAAANVVFVFGHSVVSAGVDVDKAFTFESSDTKAVVNTQDALNQITWVKSVADLGWAGGDFGRMDLLRDPVGTYTGSDNLSGFFNVWSFEIDIDRV